MAFEVADHLPEDPSRSGGKLSVRDEATILSKEHSTVSVVIASKGRPAAVSETIESLCLQTLRPHQTIVVVPSIEDLPRKVWVDDIQYIVGPHGLTSQRNRGIEVIPNTVNYVGFFDDDFEPRPDYLEQAVAFMDANESVMGLSGRVLANGDIGRRESRKLIANWPRGDKGKGVFFSTGKHHILHGCNMIIRRSVLNYEKFDENLPLYSYGEDYDLSIRLERYGLVGKFDGCIGVHLELPGGRVRELLRGYSFVANNWYFLKKGVMHLPRRWAWIRFWSVCVGKSLFTSLWHLLKGDRSIDWSERLKGHLLALHDILRGRSSPERITEI